MVKLEVGKYYKTRDGRKVGPMQERCDDRCLATYVFNDGIMAWTDEGVYNLTRTDHPNDIVSEWSEPVMGYYAVTANYLDVPPPTFKTGPIRTRREIVPGTYGIVQIWEDCAEGGLVVEIDPTRFTAEELREAAHLFNQLAEVLEDV